MNKNIATAIIAIVAIVVSVVFIVRSSPSTPTAEASPLRELPAPNEGTSLSQEVVATDPGLADRIRERMSSQEGLTELSPSQIEQIVNQSAAILQVRAGGAFDDYLELMESWGGTCRLTENDLEMVRPGWKPPEHPLSIAFYGVDQLTIEVTDASPKSRHFVGESGISQLVTMSQFQFKADRQSLIESGANQISITMPCQTNSGVAVARTDVFIWSNMDDAWLPLHTMLSTTEGVPKLRTIF